MTARIIPVAPFDLVVFGATGDLARRKLIPALYRRELAGQTPDEARIIGAARSDLGRDGFRKLAEAALRDFVSDLDEGALAGFLDRLDYVAVDAGAEAGWDDLKSLLNAAPERVRAFYLSVAPRFFGPIAERIAKAGLSGDGARIVVEKPLGRDLASAQALNATLEGCFDEDAIYRIDHYLGKETVQNLMALRFSNALFEPLWNARHIDHVQITVAESVGLEGRAGYYDHVGAMRDMAQNHLVQLLCLTAMEPPARFEPDFVRDEKLKVLRALAKLRPADIVRGQYRGYAGEAENPDTTTETFVALRAELENWRWSGVPFYLRTGKKLRARMSEIAVVFKHAPHSIFGETGHAPNTLAIRLQPDEGITLGLTIKDPGPGGMRLTDAELDMTFAERISVPMPDAYERLLMDVIRGDQTLFMRGDEVEAAWRWIDPAIAAWEEDGAKPIRYDSGASGPEDALMLTHRDGRRWREIR